MFGDRNPVSMVVYPDSDKLGLRPPAAPDDRLNFRRGDAVDYWDGETRPDPTAHPSGEHSEDGGLVCFPSGPDGAREIANPGPAAARVRLLATAHEPALRHFPQDGTLLVTPPGSLYRADHSDPHPGA
ncbi:MAG: hypothetical protein ACR2GZ_13020 [Solirubrobacteraceae bacterium]